MQLYLHGLLRLRRIDLLRLDRERHLLAARRATRDLHQVRQARLAQVSVQVVQKSLRLLVLVAAGRARLPFRELHATRVRTPEHHLARG